jgi:hypothetical protein
MRPVNIAGVSVGQNTLQFGHHKTHHRTRTFRWKI